VEEAFALYMPTLQKEQPTALYVSEKVPGEHATHEPSDARYVPGPHASATASATALNLAESAIDSCHTHVHGEV